MSLFLLLSCTGNDPAREEEPGDIVVIAETSSGRLLMADQNTGAYEGEICLYEMLPEDCVANPVAEDDKCMIFSAEHFLEDDVSSWLVSIVLNDSTLDFTPSQLSRIRPAHPPEAIWTVSSLSFDRWQPQIYGGRCAPDPDPANPDCHLNAAHTVLESGDQLIVADTNNSRVLWLEKPTAGSGPAEVVHVLDGSHPDWADWRSINNVQHLTEGDRTLLLTTFKSSISDSLQQDEGRIVLWDVTDPSLPERVWAYPEQGFLAAVHHGQVQQTASGEQWLIYAHSLGASDDPDEGLFGSVGMARFNGTQPPEYLADGILEVVDQSMGFVREVEIPAPHDWMIITDSGCENRQSECELSGRVISVSLPDLTPSGLSGAFGEQTFITLESLPEAFQHEMVFPYEADVFAREEVDSLVAEGLGSCE